MEKNYRILIVDDDRGVRDSYSDILKPSSGVDFLTTGASLFGESETKYIQRTYINYDLAVVDRGEKAVRTVEAAMKENRPFAAAFIDMKMPGINGAETAKRIWNIDPNVKIIIVTAYSEYTPSDIIQVIGREDIFYLRKPFNPEEIRQFALVMTTQWNLERERSQLSDELNKANAHLEHINKNLRNKIQEQAGMLVQSEKMASIGVLAAGVAHEINNPVSFVCGNLTTLKKYCERIFNLLEKYNELETRIRRDGNDDLMSMLDRIRDIKKKQKIQFIMDDMVDLTEESLEGTRRIGNIVKDLKTFSRIDEAELKYINLKETIDATLNIIQNEIKNKVEIKKDYGELPEIKCFPQKISQVFMNILLNAAQAIEEKGSIEITARRVKEGRRASDEYVEITISDSGHGIPKENLSKIFDPFFTTKPAGQGTGLGLSIVYDIIKSHGGHILAESQINSGTTFIIKLPMVPTGTIGLNRPLA